MSSSFLAAITFIIGTVARLYLLVLLIRLLLPWFPVNYRNPLTQAILSLTSPLVVPLRRLIPPIGKLDTATVIVAYAVQYLTIFVLLLINGVSAPILAIASTSVIELLTLCIMLFVFAIFIRVILSWLGGGGYNPAVAMITALTDPVLRPFRRVIPPMGGLDLSPLAAMILLMALNILIRGLAPIAI